MTKSNQFTLAHANKDTVENKKLELKKNTNYDFQ